MSLAGGTSAGTFGAVTETATPGTYTATFTGTAAGTAGTLTVSVTGVTLTTHPTVTVTPGPVSAANSTVSFASPTVASGGTDGVTVVVKDAAGNAVGGLASAAFAFSLSGGTSGGSFGPVTATGAAGTYTATFTAGATAGTASGLTATVSGVALNTHPTVQVTAGGVSGANSTVSFASASVASGGTDPVTIVVEDSAGNAVAGLPAGAFSFSLSGGASAGSFGAVSATATPGTYTATFTGTTAGSASTLTATVSGVALATQPAVTVTVGSVSGATSAANFATPTVAVGGTDLLTVVVKDGSGNVVSGLAGSAFGFGVSGGASAGTLGPVTETATPGTYTATFTATAAGTVSTLTATVTGVTLATRPTIQVTGGAGHHHVRTLIAVGSDAGSQPKVNVYDAVTGQLKFSLSPYAASFRGGVRVATGDVNGDGTDDIITAPGQGMVSTVKTFSGTNGAPLGSFTAYATTFLGGVFVASADVNGDGKADVIVGTGPGAGPRVEVFLGTSGVAMFNFLAFAQGFRGGVHVAAGDLNGDGHADVIVGAGPGSGRTAVFDGVTGGMTRSFVPYAGFTGGVFVTAADVNGDGHADIVTGAGPGGGQTVKAFDFASGAVLRSFAAFAGASSTGVRVAAGDINGDGVDDLIVAAPGHKVLAVNGTTLGLMGNISVLDPAFLGGIYVG
jgi:hypothetical protein